MDGDVASFLLCCLLPLGIILGGFAMRQDKKTKQEEQAREAEKLSPQGVPLHQRLEQSYFVYEISVPKDKKWQPERARYLLEQVILQSSFNSFLQIAGNTKQVVWRVIAPATVGQHVEEMRTAISSVYPQAQISSYPFRLPEFSGSFNRDISPFHLVNDFFAPIRGVDDVGNVDPLAALVQSMADLPDGGKFAFTIYVQGPTPEILVKKEEKKIQRNASKDMLVTVGAGTLANLGRGKYDPYIPVAPPKGTGRQGKGTYIEEQQRIFERKLQDQHLLNCYIFIQKDGPPLEPGTPVTLKTVNEQAIFMSQFSTPYNALVAYDDNEQRWWGYTVSNAEEALARSAFGIVDSWENGADDSGSAFRVVLDHEELALLWHLPHEEFAAPNIDWASGALPSKELLANTDGAIVGDSMVLGKSLPVRIHPKDRETHMNVVGKTGVGKSTLLHNLAHQDIADGKGVAVIDPHGRLIRDLLRVSIPDSRIDDVVVLDISNFEYPPPLNPLSSQSKDDSYTAAEIVAILETLEPGDKLPPQTGDTLLASLVTLRNEEQATARDVVRLFNDAEYRYQFINQVDDVVTQEFWMYFEGLTPSRRDEVVNPAFRRMRKFYGNPILHPMMCHPKPLDFEELIRDRKIVLLSLGVDTRKVPEQQQRLVGVTVTSLIKMAAMSSVDSPTPFHLYIDEVQDFVTAPLDKILAEARKFDLRLTIANQYLEQLRGKTLKAVMGNVGATVVFQVGQEDARAVSPYFAPEIEQADLVNMDKYHAAVKTRFLGNTQPAFTIATRPAPGDFESLEAIAREKLIRQRSIENYTPMTRDEVMSWLNERYAPRSYTTPNTGGGEHQDVDWSVQSDDQ